MKTYPGSTRAAILTAALLLAATSPAAQRFLPGPLEAIPDAKIEVRRPLGFKPDPDAPTDVHTIERLRGGHGFRGVYRQWFLTLRRHVGYAKLAHLQEMWQSYLKGERPGWKVTLLEPRTYGDLTGILLHAVPEDGKTKALIVSGAVMLGGGRVLEARLDVLKTAAPEPGVAFVDAFLRDAVLDPEALGPERLLRGDGVGLRLPRGWIVSQGDGDLRFSARHPDGATRAAIEWRRLPGEAVDPAEALRASVGDAKLASQPRPVDQVQPVVAWIASTATGRVFAVAVLGDAAFRVEASGGDVAEVVRFVEGAIRTLRSIDAKALGQEAAAHVKALRAALKKRAKGEVEAIARIERLTPLMDLPAARGGVKKALSSSTPRVIEAAARAFGARADNFTTPPLARAVRKVLRKKMPVTLGALYRGIAAAARPAALPILEAGLGRAHPVEVIAAAEGLRAPIGKPQKAFDVMVGFWERLETWAAERPQMKDAISYTALAGVLRANLRVLSGTEFATPGAARAWFDANRRHVRKR